VLVTDGLCDISRDFLDQLQRQKQQLDFTIYGVLIGVRGEEKLENFCDRV
jgi:uncharacterized protein with von Willebrand factor type A (vWA) domain